jgi:hypothetical protein
MTLQPTGAATMATGNFKSAADSTQLRELVRIFSAGFARFEHALKACGYLQPRDNGAAEAHWDAFAKASGDNGAWADRVVPMCRPALALLKNYPPRRQIVDNGQLRWEPQEAGPEPTDAIRVLVLVRRVRNNLFHGGKSPIDPARDEPLLQACVAILEAALDCDEKVRGCFLDGG